MRIAVLYPPFRRGNEYPLITQNRQFKYTNSREIRIYPLVMASLATMLAHDGHEVLWLDGINERMSEKEFDRKVGEFRPDLCVMETKAPLLTRHRDYIARLRAFLPSVKIVLTGDHVCLFPKESLEFCGSDFAVAGGDYDFLVRDLVRWLTGRGGRPGGTWERTADRTVEPREPAGFYELDSAPEIDRDLTRWELYGEAYLHHPVAYILSGRGCGGANNGEGQGSMRSSTLPGRCVFCIWQYAFWKTGARMRSPEAVADEILHLVERYKVKEIFDDNESGAVWNFLWLQEFYKALEKRRLIGKVKISSNARADSLQNDEVCRLLKACGYRLLKIGVESGDEETLRRLKKDESVEIIRRGIMNAKRYGLIVMMTTMVGYPWEDERAVRKTYRLAKELLLYRTRFGDSLQSSVVVPYPGTPLFHEAMRNGWFVDGFDPSDYGRYDMAHAVLKTPIDAPRWCKRMWRLHLHPLFLLKSFLSLRSLDDLRLALRGFVSLMGHLGDYGD